MRVLLLNSWYVPVHIIPWEAAIKLTYLKKADVLVEYAEVIRSPSVSMRVPAVIRMRRGAVSEKRGIKFSRDNVFTRDGYTCQYCAHKFPKSQLTLDHVIPKAQGGMRTWDNSVTACILCNLAKGNRTPDEWGKFPLKEPVKPKVLPIVSHIMNVKDAPPEWDGFYVELEPT